MRLTAQITKKAFIIGCSASIAITAAMIAVYISFFLSPGATLDVSAENDVWFQVHYLENDVFHGGARPHGVHYLTSYTDYIEVGSSFSAEYGDIGEDIDVTYHFTATETLAIFQQRGGSGGTPAVYREKTTLSTESGKEIPDGGTYVFDPKEYIETYRHFIEAHIAQMVAQDVIPEKVPSFSAELLVDFTYQVRVSAGGQGKVVLNQAITRGLRIPLTNEVYTCEDTGVPSFGSSVALRQFRMPGLPVCILLALWIAANVAGIYYGARRPADADSSYRREVERILHRYSDEIIVPSQPVDLSGYAAVHLLKFQEILNLAINLNKCILCAHDGEKAEFCVIADGFLYLYRMENSAMK
jgi:hypothetical protein